MYDLKMQRWFDALMNIWRDKKPERVTDLCADAFFWYETPFSEPITHKESLKKEWQSILNQTDISLKYKILSIHDNIGIAQWEALFTTQKPYKKYHLNGIYFVKLDNQGKCIEFRQWFNTKNTTRK